MFEWFKASDLDIILDVIQEAIATLPYGVEIMIGSAVVLALRFGLPPIGRFIRDCRSK